MNTNPPKLCNCGSTSVKESCDWAIWLYQWNGTAFTKTYLDGLWSYECAECGEELSDEAISYCVD